MPLIHEHRPFSLWKKSTMDVKNKYVVIKASIDGTPTESDFDIHEQQLTLDLHTNSENGSVIVKNLYVSIDAGQLHRMKTESCSRKILKEFAAIVPGKAISANGVGRVVKSVDPSFENGELVIGSLIWGEYTIVSDGNMLQKVDPMGFPLSYFAGGILGSSGLTAYGGFYKFCYPKKGEKVFVSAACGSVGILVGQFAKFSGCYVVGSAGTEEKVKLLKEKFGFDDGFNYKQENDLKSALKRCFPDGIDIYFDNVGGEMLGAVIDNMNINGRIVACGAIAEYTNVNRRVMPDMIAVIFKRIRIQGFVVVDFLDIYQEFISFTIQLLQDGQMKTIEDVSYGVENIPSAFVDLFHGKNIGKKVVRVGQEEGKWSF